MDTRNMLKRGRDIWGDERLSFSHFIVRMGKVFGDICRWERDAPGTGNLKVYNPRMIPVLPFINTL